MKKTISLLLGMLCLGPLISQTEYDSLQLELKKPIHDTDRIWIWYCLADILQPNDNWPYYYNIKDLAEKDLKQPNLLPILKTYYLKFLGRAYHHIGESYMGSQPDSTLFWCKKSNKLSEPIHQYDLMVKNYYLTGNIYSRRGNFKQAATEFFNALKLLEAKKEETREQVDILLSIGEMYHMKMENDTALNYFNKGLKISERIKNQRRLRESLNAIALVYMEKENYAEAKKYYNRVVPLISNDHELATSLLDIGYITEHEGFLDSAFAYYKKALKLTEKSYDRSQYFRNTMHLSNVSLKLNKKDLALFYAKQCQQIANSLHYSGQAMNINQLFYNIYKAQGNGSLALAYYEKFMAAKDSATAETSKKAIVEQKLKYEFEKKELLANAENDKKISTLKIEQQEERKVRNIWLGLLIALLVLLVGGACFLYIYFKQKAIISDQKSNILKQKLQLSQMNPHFIFNSLNTIQNYIFKEDKLHAGVYLSQFAELMRMILDFSRQDYIPLAAEEKFLNNYLALQKLRFTEKLSYSISIDPDLDPQKTLIPPMLAQPFIENSIEHGIINKEGAGHITVTLTKKDNLLIYEIEDDGIGLEKAMALKRSIGSSYESLGTLITKDRINGLNDKKEITFEIIDLSKQAPQQQGVRVKFSVPYKLV